MDTIKQETTKTCWQFLFNETGQRWPALGITILASHRKKTSLLVGEAWAFLAFSFHPLSANCKMFVASCKQWRENLDCPSSGLRGLCHWFQPELSLAVQIRGIYQSLTRRLIMMHGKEKDVWRQIKELFCIREFAVSSDPRSAPQPKAIFLEESHDSHVIGT